MSIIASCLAVAGTSLQGAVMILLIITAFAMILRGSRGAAWVLRTAFAPFRALLERRVTAYVQLCGMTIVSYYVGQLFHR